MRSLLETVSPKFRKYCPRTKADSKAKVNRFLSVNQMKITSFRDCDIGPITATHFSITYSITKQILGSVYFWNRTTQHALQPTGEDLPVVKLYNVVRGYSFAVIRSVRWKNFMANEDENYQNNDHQQSQLAVWRSEIHCTPSSSSANIHVNHLHTRKKNFTWYTNKVS